MKEIKNSKTKEVEASTRFFFFEKKGDRSFMRSFGKEFSAIWYKADLGGFNLVWDEAADELEQLFETYFAERDQDEIH